MYTEDSGNATPPVSHCDHNKIKAAAVTKLSIPSEIRYTSDSPYLCIRVSEILLLLNDMIIIQVRQF